MISLHFVFKLSSSTLYLSILSFFGSDSTIFVQVMSSMYFPIFFVPACTEAFFLIYYRDKSQGPDVL